MSIAFRDSERSTVGLEWEVQIVDPKTLELSQKAARILVDVHYTSDCWLVKGEMHQNMLEFVSRKRVSVAECAADMEEAIDAAMPYAEELGVGLSAEARTPSPTRATSRSPRRRATGSLWNAPATGDGRW